MDEKRWAALLTAIVLGAAGTWYYLNHVAVPPPLAEAPPPALETAPEPVPEPVPAPPPPDYPLPPPTADAPALPKLADSDGAVRDALSSLLGGGSFAAFMVPTQLIQHIVVTIDNLPRKRVALSLRPIKRTPPPFLIREDSGHIYLDPANAERYAAQVALFDAVSAEKLVALYVRWYPLFQRAYVELGYPERSFNNRLVEVLDHLLATPEAPAEIELTQPKVVYEFADPTLEALSAGQKTLLRLSPVQRADVIKQLRAIRAAVIAQVPAKS